MGKFASQSGRQKSGRSCLGLAILAGAAALAVFTPGQADARVFVGVGLGGGWYGGPGYYAYPPYYGPAYYNYAYAPPPTVVYAQPAYVAAPAPTYAAPPPPPPGATGGFTDNFGRSCRHADYGNGTLTTICRQTDGSWVAVN